LPLLSLFSGPGGLDLGFEQAGFEPLLALDIDRAAVQTYNCNRLKPRDRAKVADLSDVDPSTIIARWEENAGADMLPIGIIGGPPCQSFSVSNVHKLAEDPRAKLPLAYARILKAFNERFDLEFFVFENVAGLGHRTHSSSLDAFLRNFRRAGFHVKRFYLDAVRFQVPQYRNRMFIIGLNKARYKVSDFVPPAGDGSAVTVREAIGHLPEPVYFSRDRKPSDAGLHPNHWCMNPRSKKFGNGALKAGEMLGRSFRMLEWGSPSWTVAYGHREVHVHPNGERRLSVYEAMLLQDFPPDYELRGTLTDQIRQVSDAVPPPLARALAASIAEALFVQGTRSAAKAQERKSGQAGQSGLAGVQTVAPRSTSA
jgi:DNA (cytosine-5)-methyltransferase 1